MLLIPEVGPQLADTYGLVMHAWQHALRPVPADQIHATLAWSGHRSQPRSRRSPAGQRSRPAWVPYGVRCEIGTDGTPSDRPLEAYATAATEALRAVFGDDKVPDLHLALAYGTGGPIAQLHRDRHALEPLPEGAPALGNCRIVLVDADTFATHATPWARSIDLIG